MPPLRLAMFEGPSSTKIKGRSFTVQPLLPAIKLEGLFLKQSA